MKALFYNRAQNRLEIKEVNSPIPKGNEVLVKIKYVLLSNEDLKKAKENVVPSKYFVGEVVGAGPDVQDLKTGDYVTSDPVIPCEACQECKEDNQTFCQNLQITGQNINGPLQEYFLSKSSNLVKIPYEIPLESAIFIPPLAHLLSFLPPTIELGSSACITLNDIEGLLFSKLLSYSGVTRIVILSEHPRIRTLLKPSLNFLYTEDPNNFISISNELEERPSLAFDFTGELSKVKYLIKAVRPGSSLHLSRGLDKKNGENECQIMENILSKNITLVSKSPKTFAERARKATNLIQSQAIKPGEFITHTFEFGELAEITFQLSEPFLVAIKVS